MASSRSVTITADNPAVEIHLLDHTFGRVAEGFGTITCDLLPGVYLCKTKVGPVTTQMSIVIEPGTEPVHLHAELPLRSALPIYGLPTSHEYQSFPAGHESQQIHRDFGGDAQIYLFIREVENFTIPWVSPGVGLRLKDFEGNVVADLSVDGPHDEQAGWVAINVQLPAGSYIFSSEYPGAGTVEMTVVASSGFQTQVFMILSEFTLQNMRTFRLPDMASASIQMARIGRGFQPMPKTAESDLARIAEMARYALVSNRNVMAGSDLRTMMRDKTDNPMLGIIGGHLLLREDPLDHELLSVVVSHLDGLVPNHPDVRSLRVVLGDVAEPFLVPPMLLTSWKIALDHALVQPDTVSAEIAKGLIGTRPWVMWRADHLKLPRPGFAAAVAPEPEPEASPSMSMRAPAAPAPMPAAAGGGGAPDAHLGALEMLDRLRSANVRSTLDMSPVAQRAVNALNSDVESFLDSDALAPNSGLQLEDFAKQLMVPVETAKEALQEVYEVTFAPAPNR